MSDILLLLALLIVVLAALYLVAARSDVVAAWLYRLLRDPDPWGWQARLRARLLAIKRAEPESWYPPEAAEAPPYDREPRCALAPRVIAGADLDRHLRPIDQVNADFSALLAADRELASLRDLDLSAYYVLPEGER